MNINASADPNAVATPADDPVIVVTRAFDAPRALVYACYTDPKHLAHFWGPRDSATTARLDLRPGGVWRIDWRYANGGAFGYTSVYLALLPPERIVYRDAPDGWQGGLDGLPPAQTHTTILLAENAGRTTVTVTVRFRTLAARDENMKRGFATMVCVGHDRLAEYLPTV